MPESFHGKGALPLLVLSQHARPSYAFELLSESAERVGYLLKVRVGDVDELADAVRRVGQGGTVLDPVVVSQLVGRPREGRTRFTTSPNGSARCSR